MRVKLLSALALSLLFAQPLFAHCEIPCGIYDDEMRVQLIEEHITTLEKSVKTILSLSAEKDTNYNQIVRWVNNKEKHAGEIQQIVTQYFMTQRVKPAAAGEAEAHGRYMSQLTTLHEMLIQAMKAKQTADLAPIEKLRALTAQFREAYFGPTQVKQTP